MTPLLPPVRRVQTYAIEPTHLRGAQLGQLTHCGNLQRLTCSFAGGARPPEATPSFTLLHVLKETSMKTCPHEHGEGGAASAT